VGLAETKNFAEGYEAIFGSKSADRKPAKPKPKAKTPKSKPKAKKKSPRKKK
jgi:hypothetical protein